MRKSATLLASVAIAVLGLVFAGTLLWVDKENERLRDAYVSERGAQLRAALAVKKARLGHAIDALRQDVVFLAQTPPISGMVRASANQGIDPRDKDPYSAWEARLQEIISAFLRAHPDYFQVRLIGAANEGRELVRVENRDGRIQVAQHEALSGEGDQKYFRAGLLLTSGRVHLSGFDLNREGGRIEEPHRPILRAVTPVFDASGHVFGMVEAEKDMGALFAASLPGLPQGMAGYVADQQGRYLYHPDVKRTFGFEFGDKSNIADDFPVLRQLFEAQTQGDLPLQAAGDRSGYYVAAERIFFDPSDPSRYLVLAYGMPTAGIEVQAAQIPKLVVAAILLLMFAGGVLSSLMMSRMFSAFRRISAGSRPPGAADQV